MSEGNLNLDFKDEIVAGTVVAHQGRRAASAYAQATGLARAGCINRHY